MTTAAVATPVLQRMPMAVFEYLSGEVKIHPRTDMIANTARYLRSNIINATEPNTQSVLLIECLPELAKDVGRSVIKQPKCLEAVLRSPMSAATLLVEFYSEMHSVLEPVVLQDGEALFHLLTASRMNLIRLEKPIGEYMEVLLKYPFWASRLAHETKNRDYSVAIMEWANKNAQSDAGAAFFHLIEDDTADVSPFVEIIEKDPFYAYLAAIWFREREYKPSGGVMLSSPRWAYHFIALDQSLLHESIFVGQIVQCPGWTAEYLVHSGKVNSWREVSAFYNEAHDKAGGANSVNPYLKAFYLFTERIKVHLPK